MFDYHFVWASHWLRQPVGRGNEPRWASGVLRINDAYFGLSLGICDGVVTRSLLNAVWPCCGKSVDPYEQEPCFGKFVPEMLTPFVEHVKTGLQRFTQASPQECVAALEYWLQIHDPLQSLFETERLIAYGESFVGESMNNLILPQVQTEPDMSVLVADEIQAWRRLKRE